jgi:hypothetical protein
LLKVLKPLLFKGNNISLISIALINTAFINTTPISIIINNIINNNINRTNININPYKLNKLNIRKLGFIKDKEIIIRHKFKYFKKGNKKGQIYNRQLFVVIKL